ncbi:MAG: response regulator transcription factor [Clostridium sp.]|nr:response regulator transcription factor [Clostridium sp.]
MIKIMLVDDHEMVREGVKQLIEFDGDIQVIAQASNGEDCLKLLHQEVPDILLLDVNMIGMNGIEVLQEIRKERIPVKVAMLTVHNEVEYLVNLVDIGVEGYILKDSSSAELVRAIKHIYQGETYIQPDLIPALNSRLVHRDEDREKIDALTRRELEVLKLVAKGHFNKEIAIQLDISERTVKNHISSIFRKIDVSDRTQAAVFAIKNNLITI